MSGRPTRYIIDHVNHDDLIGGEGGGIPEAPADGFAFGRVNRTWTPVLPLGGGELAGPLGVPNGSVPIPGLQLGAADGTGVSRVSDVLVLGVRSAPVAVFFGGATISAQVYGPLSMLNNRVTQVGDATAATDALNLRTGDARYAPGPWSDFVADSGWDSTLRYRRVVEGLQFDGMAGGPLPANARARIGVLPEGYRPARPQYGSGVVIVPPNTYGFGMIDIEPDGQVWTVWTVAGTGSVFGVSVILALD